MLNILKFHPRKVTVSHRPDGFDYDAIERDIAETYREIFALDTVEKQSRALATWYEYVQKTCHPESLCIECLNELRA